VPEGGKNGIILPGAPEGGKRGKNKKPGCAYGFSAGRVRKDKNHALTKSICATGRENFI